MSSDSLVGSVVKGAEDGVPIVVEGVLCDGDFPAAYSSVAREAAAGAEAVGVLIEVQQASLLDIVGRLNDGEADSKRASQRAAIDASLARRLLGCAGSPRTAATTRTTPAMRPP